MLLSVLPVLGAKSAPGLRCHFVEVGKAMEGFFLDMIVFMPLHDLVVNVHYYTSE